MRNFLHRSDVIRVAAPYTLATGDGCQVGAIFGMATGPVANGALFDMMTTGVFDITAASAVVAAAGSKAYWDNAARNITNDGRLGILVGVFESNKVGGQVVATIAIGVMVRSGAGAPTPHSADFALTNLDDETVHTCTTALSVNVAGGLTPQPNSIVFPPGTGNLTVTCSGGATINGATTPIIRTFANNRLGVYIFPNPNTPGDYTVSGS